MFYSKFSDRLNNMISYKKALGFSESSYMHYLRDFDNYCIKNFLDETELTQEIIMDWCQKREGESINSLNRRLAAIREFGRYLLSIGVSAYVMPPKMTARQTRYVPHIFTNSELSSFFYGTDNIKETSEDPLCAYILPVLFRLIYCCGLRPNEGLQIKINDLNLESGRLFIRQSKRHKDRIVMLSKDLLELCIKYNIIRQKTFDFGEYFFPSEYGRVRNKQWLVRNFKKCWEIAEISNFSKPNPRVYDFRHTFATRNLYNWMDNNVDLNLMLPYLSSYMGHSSFSNTAYYIHLLPDRLKSSPAIKWELFEDLLPEVQHEKVER